MPTLEPRPGVEIPVTTAQWVNILAKKFRVDDKRIKVQNIEKQS